jgi:hypothetical protein
MLGSPFSAQDWFLLPSGELLLSGLLGHLLLLLCSEVERFIRAALGLGWQRPLAVIMLDAANHKGASCPEARIRGGQGSGVQPCLALCSPTKNHNAITTESTCASSRIHRHQNELGIVVENHIPSTEQIVSTERRATHRCFNLFHQHQGSGSTEGGHQMGSLDLVLIIAIPISTPANLFLHIPPLPFRPHFSPVNRGLGACGWCRPLNRDRDFLSI